MRQLSESPAKTALLQQLQATEKAVSTAQGLVAHPAGHREDALEDALNAAMDAAYNARRAWRKAQVST